MAQNDSLQFLAAQPRFSARTKKEVLGRAYFGFRAI